MAKEETDNLVLVLNNEMCDLFFKLIQLSQVAFIYGKVLEASSSWSVRSHFIWVVRMS